MVRYLVRRLLIALTTLVGISVVVFLVTTIVPDPLSVQLEANAALRRIDPKAYDELDEQRKERFLDLPRFVNARPADVRTQVDECVRHLAAGDAEGEYWSRRLVRLGSAAFPHLLPELDRMPPEARGRIAVALAPVAERMGVSEGVRLRNPEEAALFWSRFWEDRSVEYTTPSARRAIIRLLRKPNETRRRDVVELDTFALSELIRAMGEMTDRRSLALLTSLAKHAAGRGDAIELSDDDARVQEVLEDWRAWWYVHDTDFIVLTGTERVTATAGETRYGKWLGRVARGDLGKSAQDGQPVARKLAERVPVTLTLALLALLIGFGAGIPAGVALAWRRGRGSDVAFATVTTVLHSAPVFLVASLLALFATGLGSDLALGSVALGAGTFAIVSRQQRASMLEVLSTDWIRTARAKGVGAFRLLVVHALRNALAPTISLVGTQLPFLLGGAFVVETVFSLKGLGYETLRAVETHDAQELVATLLVVSLVTTAGLAISDLLQGVIDPRARERAAQVQTDA
jgi:ABC-type dipeptide/oligopeptide/nickel transport system permease component